MIRNSRIAAVVPAFRVRDYILGVIAGIGPEVDDIIVVDDHCPERSGRLVAEKCCDLRVRVLFHDANQGVGGSTVTGMIAALSSGASCIVKIDGDGQHDPRLIPALVTPLLENQADYTKGNRFYWLDDVKDMPLKRLIGNVALSFFAKLSSGYWTIFDPTNGYVAIHADVLRQIPLAKVSRRYFFETDMLFWLYIARAKVVDVPMRAIYRGNPSSLKPIRQIPLFLVRHIGNTLRRILYAYVLRNFSLATLYLLVGLLSFLLGAADTVVVWIEHFDAQNNAPTGTIMIPALLLLVGVQLILAYFAVDVASTPIDPIHDRLKLAMLPHVTE